MLLLPDTENGLITNNYCVAIILLFLFFSKVQIGNIISL